MVAGEPVQLLGCLGALHRQPVRVLAQFLGWQVVCRSSERHLAGRERHPRAPRQPLDLGCPAGRLDLVGRRSMALTVHR
jgi:hypothetical protein